MTSVAKKPYLFVIIRGGGGGSGTPVPTLESHMLAQEHDTKHPAIFSDNDYVLILMRSTVAQLVKH